MKSRIYIKIGLLVLAICALIPLYSLFIKEDKIIITSIPAPDIQEQIDEYIKAGKCNNGDINENEAGVVIELTEWQRRKWLEAEYNSMNNMIEQANSVPHMRISVSADTQEFLVEADKEVSFQNMATYFGIISYNIELIQLLEGEESWGFEFCVKDLKTEKVLYNVYFPEEKVKVYESFWDEIEE